MQEKRREKIPYFNWRKPATEQRTTNNSERNSLENNLNNETMERNPKLPSIDTTGMAVNDTRTDYDSILESFLTTIFARKGGKTLEVMKKCADILNSYIEEIEEERMKMDEEYTIREAMNRPKRDIPHFEFKSRHKKAEQEGGKA